MPVFEICYCVGWGGNFVYVRERAKTKEDAISQFWDKAEQRNRIARINTHILYTREIWK